ncbi:Gamma-glutamyltranspeptidase 3 [Apostasia shenzhenica]|uniref:Glutathione hydrolase n=1 Tax=Apostasia shenzhenica TaxID=1088818 RepID=A0A2I0ALG1_9ASPA|nr:Gamma-glutamyltranspeptidase 3 [Apostasia shenzhenica]
MAVHADVESPLLGCGEPPPPSPPATASSRCRIWTLAAATVLLCLGQFLLYFIDSGGDFGLRSSSGPEIVESEVGVVAADDWRCSEIGVSALRSGGHAVDAAVAAALCLGVVHPMSSGIGGGAFTIVRPAGSSTADAFDSRETAPMAASQNMYEKYPSSKAKGALSMGIPGELAGLHAVWLKYGKLPWQDLFRPSVKLARNGFSVEPYLAQSLKKSEDIIADPGLRQVFAPAGKILQKNDTLFNPKLADALEAIAIDGPQAFYNGSIGEKFVDDVRNAGGIVTMEDLRNYRVRVKEALAAEIMGYRVLGMPPPSSGTLGLALVLNILTGYKSLNESRGLIGLHRLIEAFKHMFALRMNLGDPDFVDIAEYVSDMLSPAFADEIRKKIFDNTTFDPSYYLPQWNQLKDHGTSHVCVVDAERNAVSMTTTVNNYFGAGVLSRSTGIVLNNEMNDFSIPTDNSPDHLPPAPANFIEPGKRPLSSMTPVIVLQENQLAGVVGGSGGLYIIPAVTQVFLNHFLLRIEPLEAVQRPRVYHKLIPNIVLYENWTAIDGENIQLDVESRAFLKQRGHHLRSLSGGAVCQLVTHNLQVPASNIGGRKDGIFRGMLTAVSDPRKDGRPAGI